MSFAENLKLIRKEKGITQEDLAEMLQVSRQAVSKWEAGTGYPETDKLLIIARELNVSLDYLMDNEPDIIDSEPKDVVYPKTDKIVIATFDGSQTVDCLSVRYDKILFTKLYRKQSVSGRRKKQTPVLESLPFPSNCRPIFSY